ncbi:hypothetical protein Tco_1426916, partial [Tanacetum coccineum]
MLGSTNSDLAVLRQVPVNAVKQSSPRAAASISTARTVNIAAPKSKVNDALPKTYSYFKAHSSVRRDFNQKSAAKTNNLNEKVKTAKHAGIGDQQEMLLTIPPKTVDHTCLKDLTMLIYKADSREANYVNMQSRMDGRTCNIKQKCVKSQTPRQAKRGRDTKIPQSGGPPEKVGDEAVHKELGDRMERAATTASSLEAEQDSGSGPDWLFDVDLLTNSMNYEPVSTGNQTNKNAVANDVGKKTNEEPAHEGERNGQEKERGKEGYANRTNRDSTVSLSVSNTGQNFTNAGDLPSDPLIPD